MVPTNLHGNLKFTVLPVGSLDQEVDRLLVRMFQDLLKDVPLPSALESIGGRSLMESTFRSVIQNVPLDKKLDLVIRAHSALEVLIDRFAKMWITQVKGQEFITLQQALTKANLMYPAMK